MDTGVRFTSYAQAIERQLSVVPSGITRRAAWPRDLLEGLDMAVSSVGRRCGGRHALSNVVAVAACVSMLASCASASYQAAALQASEGGDQKAAVSMAKKEVARFSGADKCSPTSRLDCGTLALAYGALAGYQILDRDSAAGEGSFIRAKGALNLTDPAIRASATGMVYRDVSEAFWKAGDHARAIAIFKEGRAAGADQWLFMSSAARAAAQAADRQPTQQSTDQRQVPASALD